MPTRLSASGRASRPFSSDGNGSGSVLALRTFCAIVSASSVRLIRELSDASDFDIFLVPSRKLITRVAGPVITGSGSGKNNPSLEPWLRIDAAGNEGRGDFAGIARQFGRATPHLYRLRQRVHVDHAIDAVMRLLQLHEVDDRAEVIAEMQIASRLDA